MKAIHIPVNINTDMGHCTDICAQVEPEEIINDIIKSGNCTAEIRPRYRRHQFYVCDRGNKIIEETSIIECVIHGKNHTWRCCGIPYYCTVGDNVTIYI